MGSEKEIEVRFPVCLILQPSIDSKQERNFFLFTNNRGRSSTPSCRPYPSLDGGNHTMLLKIGVGSSSAAALQWLQH